MKIRPGMEDQSQNAEDRCPVQCAEEEEKMSSCTVQSSPVQSAEKEEEEVKCTVQSSPVQSANDVLQMHRDVQSSPVQSAKEGLALYNFVSRYTKMSSAKEQVQCLTSRLRGTLPILRL